MRDAGPFPFRRQAPQIDSDDHISRILIFLIAEEGFATQRGLSERAIS